MATISSIVSKLTLDTAQFNTRLQRSKRKARSWGRDVSRISANVGKAVAAGTTIAAAGIAVMTAKQLESIDASAKFARSIDLQVDKLAGLRFAGDLNGVANEQFDKSLQKMVRSIGDASRVGGTLSKVFDDLDLSAEDLSKKSPDRQLAILADAFGQVEDRTTAASLASQIFGRQGTAMLNVLDQGSAGLAAAQAEAVGFGIALSDIDARMVEEANDQIARVSLKLKGVQQQLAVDLAPYIASIAEQITQIESNSLEAGDGVGVAIEKVGRGAAFAADAIDVMSLAWLGVRGITQSIVFIVTDLVAMTIEAAGSIARLVGMDFGTPLILENYRDEQNRAMESIVDNISETYDRLVNNPTGERITEAFDEIEAGAERTRRAAAEAAEAAEAAKDQTAAIEGAGDAYDDQLKNMGKVAETLDDLQSRIERFGLSDSALKLFDLEHLGATADELEQARKAMDSIRMLEEQRERSDSIAGIVDDLERQVRLFGVTADQMAVLDLESLGASDEDIARATAAIEQRLVLESNVGSAADLASSSVGPSLVRAGGAEAQAAAFRAQRQMNPQLDEAKKQTGLLGRVAGSLETIEERSLRKIFGGSVEEVGI